MRIVLVNQFFHPDRSATSQLATDLAVGLASAGHEVMALASRAGCDGGVLKLGSRLHPRLQVVRVPATGWGRGGRFRRLADYGSYFALAAGRLLRDGAGDVVITLTTPPLVGLLGLWARQRYGAAFVHWLMDLYPDVAFQSGQLRPAGRSARLLQHLGEAILHGADRLVVLGECMRDRVLAKGVPPERVVLIDNWSDSPPADTEPVFNAGHRRDEFVVGYSGNLGVVHEADTLLKAMRLLRGAPVGWRLTGGGCRMHALQQAVQAEGLERVHFGRLQARRHLARHLALADVHLVTLRSAALGLVVPSKLYGIMAAGRPVVFIGPAESHVGRIIRRRQIGFVIPEGDAESLVRAIQWLRTRPAEREAMGRRARAAFLAEFDKPLALAKWLAVVESVAPLSAVRCRAA